MALMKKAHADLLTELRQRTWNAFAAERITEAEYREICFALEQQFKRYEIPENGPRIKTPTQFYKARNRYWWVDEAHPTTDNRFAVCREAHRLAGDQHAWYLGVTAVMGRNELEPSEQGDITW